MAGGSPQRRFAAGVDSSEKARERLLNAVAKVAGEQGYRHVTVDRVAHNAGVTPTTFAAYFDSTEQALLAAHDCFLERLWLEAVVACQEDTRPWPDRVKATLATILASVVEAGSLARAFVVEATASSLAGAERQVAAVDRFAALLREGRAVYPNAESLPAATERVLVGGVASIISGCLLVEDPQTLLGLEQQLVELLLLPYLGADEARQLAAG